MSAVAAAKQAPEIVSVCFVVLDKPEKLGMSANLFWVWLKRGGGQLFLKELVIFNIVGDFLLL
jgi:hypothetical protein